MPLLKRIMQLAGLFIVLVLSSLGAVAHRFERSTIDPDLWWHVRIGDWILQTHSFPHSGVFSQYANRAWVAYSWGFEVMMASLFRLAGLAALPLTLAAFRPAILFAVFVMAFLISRRFWLSWLLTVAAAFPLASILVVRPILFTVLFFIIEIGLIFYARTRNSVAPLYWLPLVLLLWANTHIQFIYGLFVLTVFIACELLRLAAPAEKQSWISASPIETTPVRLLLVYCASVLATFIGPYWGAAYGTIVKYVAYVQQYNEISELLALDFRSINDYFVVILLIAACIVIGRKGLDLFTGSLIVSTALVTFRSRRDEWFVSLVACAVIAAAAADRGQTAAARVRFQRLAQYAGVLVLTVALTYAYAWRVVGLTFSNLASGIDAMYPIRATEYLRQHHLAGPIYNTYDWGGFIIFNLREYPVSIDGRYDLHGPVLFKRATDTLNAVNWKTDPDLAKAGFALLPKGQPLNAALAADPDYKLVYTDHIAQIFVKTTSVK